MSDAVRLLLVADSPSTLSYSEITFSLIVEAIIDQGTRMANLCEGGGKKATVTVVP